MTVLLVMDLHCYESFVDFGTVYERFEEFMSGARYMQDVLIRSFCYADWAMNMSVNGYCYTDLGFRCSRCVRCGHVNRSGTICTVDDVYRHLIYFYDDCREESTCEVLSSEIAILEQQTDSCIDLLLLDYISNNFNRLEVEDMLPKMVAEHAELVILEH